MFCYLKKEVKPWNCQIQKSMRLFPPPPIDGWILLLLGIFTFPPIHTSVQLGKRFPDFSLFLDAAQQGMPENSVGKAQKHMNFIQALNFQQVEELLSGFIWYFWLFHIMPTIFCSVLLYAQSLMLNVPRETWMLTMAQWGSWHWC